MATLGDSAYLFAGGVEMKFPRHQSRRLLSSLTSVNASLPFLPRFLIQTLTTKFLRPPTSDAWKFHVKKFHIVSILQRNRLSSKTIVFHGLPPFHEIIQINVYPIDLCQSVATPRACNGNQRPDTERGC